MAYKTRPGIVRLRICGAYLLAPTRAASEECPHVMRISFLGALIWKLLEKEHDTRGMCALYSAFTRKPDKEVERDVADFLGTLCKNGFLIEVPDEDDAHDED